MLISLNTRRSIAFLALLAFLGNGLAFSPAYAEELVLPTPGTMVHLSPAFNPPVLKGIKVHPDNPFRFDFILDKGDVHSPPLMGGVRGGLTDSQLKQESTKLIKYFLASLTTPEKDMWVNLSPYEKDRIVPESFGQTEMGRDLLAEDYILKQITASLIYPEDAIGKRFWKRVYEESQRKFGNTNIPVNTFNKVWIVPHKAVVYENAKAKTAYVVESSLKVMLEQDYLAMDKNKDLGVVQSPVQEAKEFVITRSAVTKQSLKEQSNNLVKIATTPTGSRNDISTIGSQIVREVIIPELTKEINQGQNFANLRQVYNSLILAAWYKKKIKDSILVQVYTDKNKVKGLEYKSYISDSPSHKGEGNNDVNDIYDRYLQAFKKGAYNYIKEEQDPITNQAIPKKYFSGGLEMNMAMLVTTTDSAMIESNTGNLEVAVNMKPIGEAGQQETGPVKEVVPFSNFISWMNSIIDSERKQGNALDVVAIRL